MPAPALQGKVAAGEAAGTSYTATFDAAVTSVANRYVFAVIYYESGLGEPVVSGVTCGAVNLVKLGEITPTVYASGHTTRGELWGAPAPPDGATGVTVSFDGTVTLLEGHTIAFWVSGASQEISASNVLKRIVHNEATSTLEVTTNADNSLVISTISEAQLGGGADPAEGQTSVIATNVSGTRAVLGYEVYATAATQNDTWTNTVPQNLLRGAHFAIIVPEAVPVDPPNLQVTALGSKATLTWDASPTAGITGYSICRRVQGDVTAFDPNVNEIAVVGNVLTYEDYDITQQTYEWKVFGIYPDPV